MLKYISQLEHKIGDKTYQFLCDPNSPLSEVKDALFQFLRYVGQVEDAVKEQQEKAKDEAETKDQAEKVEDGNKQ